MKEARREEGRGAGGNRALARAVAHAFDGLVCAAVETPAERQGQARVLAGLVGSGLVCAALSPLGAFSGAGLGTILAPMAAGGLFLSGAAALSATGRLGPVLAGMFATLGGLGGLGLASGGPAAVAGGLALGASAVGGAVLAARHARRRRAERAAGSGERERENASLPALLSGPLLRFDAEGRPLPADGNHALPLDRIHMHDRLAFLHAFADLRRGSEAARAELRLLPGEESEQVILLSLAPVRDGAGVLTHVVGTARDITQERCAEARLETTLKAAQDASEAKSRFLANISHELRTPLNAIIGFTDILEKEYFGGFESPRQKEYVELIGRSGEHLLQVVNGLLDISKIEAGRYEIAPERFSLREAMESAGAMVKAEAERKGLMLILQEPDKGAEIHADPRAFHQILLNLLSNAVKFTEEGSVRLSARIEGGRQLVVVEDTGIGIAQADLTRIAEPFVQLGRDRPGAQPGTGLGLSLVKGLCELHGGRLTIESRPGIGTTASVSIPIDCADASPGVPEKIVSLTDARKKNHIQAPAPADRRTA
ncbi:sensor histidine kinase [Aureimonas populi]|uniref:histidine kinase n=1 Tax=Aureimonas populi TaxID=1701758 RepID=A0ABW5CK53_9HYPH|nr:PAS domain-containing sensor histidine kinase [Aureimonas populi]